MWLATPRAAAVPPLAGSCSALGGADRAEALTGLDHAGGHALLSSLAPGAGVVLLLGADLAVDLQDAVVVAVHPVRDRAGEGVLGVGVDVHLDDAVAHRGGDLLVGGAGTAVHDQVERRVLDPDLGLEAVAEALGDVRLDLAQDLRAQLDVTGLVGAVHVAEGQRRDVTAVLAQAQGLDGAVGVVGSGVETGVLLTLDAVLLAADSADLDLEDGVGRAGALEHVHGDLNVVVQGLRRAVPQVGLEHRQLAALDLVGLDLQQRVDPAVKELLGAVVRVEAHDAGVEVTDGAGVGGEGEGTSDAVQAGGAGPVGGAAVGDLDDTVRLGVGEALEGSGEGLGARDVDRGDGVLASLGAVKHVRVGLRGCDGH